MRQSALGVSSSFNGASRADAHAMMNEIKNAAIAKSKNATAISMRNRQTSKWNVVPLALPPMPCNTTDFLRLTRNRDRFAQFVQV